MRDKQNEFYSSISEYYHEIFPYNPAQLQYVKHQVGNLEGKEILDIGCATGELAYQLAKEGAVVTGIDLNEELLNQAIQRKKHPNLTFRKGDMLELEDMFSSQKFDVVICFGNTLVHLSSVAMVKQMFQEVRAVSIPNAAFLLQILNYDYIIADLISELPVIDSENIRFIRKYGIEEDKSHIRFITSLHIKKNQKVIKNETYLLALKSDTLVSLLEGEGFTHIKLYSNFKEEKFGGKHIPLVVRAKTAD